MARAGDELVNPATGQRLVFKQTAADTGGELLLMETWYRAGGPRAPAHYHPKQDERFEVLSGAVHCVIDGEERVLSQGEVLEVPRGTVHEFGGHPDEDAHVRWETRPALRTEDFFEAVFQGGATRMELAPIALEHREEFRLASPPWPVQRVGLTLLSGMAKLRR